MADFPKVIPPGQEGKINVSIDGRKMTTSGIFGKDFAVNTNDPENAQITLVIRGNMVQAFQISGELRMEGFSDGKFKVEITVKNLLPAPVNIKGVEWSADGKSRGLAERIGLKLETIEKGKEYRLKAWNKKELAPGDLVTHVVLKTDHPKLKDRLVPVTILISKEVVLRPIRITYGEILLGPGSPKSFDRNFIVAAARGDSLRITRVVPSRDDMLATFRERTPGREWEGTVWITPKQIGPYIGSLKVYTNYPNYRELTLGVEGVVEEAGQR